MADRSFDIDAELNIRGISLNKLAPFSNQKFQFSSEQVESTSRIAEVRIYVERIMEYAIRAIAIHNAVFTK